MRLETAMKNDLLSRNLRIILAMGLIYITIGLSFEGAPLFLKIGAWLAYWIVFGFRSGKGRLPSYRYSHGLRLPEKRLVA
jgi:hypothetical protein